MKPNVLAKFNWTRPNESFLMVLNFKCSLNLIRKYYLFHVFKITFEEFIAWQCERK